MEGLCHSATRRNRQETLDGFLHVPLFLRHLKEEKSQQETGADITEERQASNNMHYPNYSVLLLSTWTPSFKKKLGREAPQGGDICIPITRPQPCLTQ